MKRAILLLGTLALAMPAYVIAQSAGLTALISSGGDTNGDGNLDANEAINAVYTLATNLHSAQNATALCKAKTLSAAPTATECTAGGEQVVYGSDFFVCTTANAVPIRITKCDAGYAGLVCEFSDAVTCNGNGLAQNDGSCVCNSGWSGADCGTAAITYASRVTPFTNWTFNSYVTPSNGNRMDFHAAPNFGSDHAYYDLTTVSDTAWVLRFKVTLTDYAANSGSSDHIGIGLTNSSQAGWGDDQESIAWATGTGSNDRHYYVRAAGGPFIGNSTGPSNSHHSFGFAQPSVTTHWVELKRTSATTYSCEMFSDSFVTSVDQHSGTINGSVTSMRYLAIKQRGQTNSNHLQGYFEDVEFYDGVSSVP